VWMHVEQTVRTPYEARAEDAVSVYPCTMIKQSGRRVPISGQEEDAVSMCGHTMSKQSGIRTPYQTRASG